MFFQISANCFDRYARANNAALYRESKLFLDHLDHWNNLPGAFAIRESTLVLIFDEICFDETRANARAKCKAFANFDG